ATARPTRAAPRSRAAVRGGGVFGVDGGSTPLPLARFANRPPLSLTRCARLCISPVLAGPSWPGCSNLRESPMKLRAVKGMNDILPDEARRWQRLEHAFRRIVELYGYEELRTPLLEQKELFDKSTGETSEVVQKQMFTLERGGEVLALRPEGTPSTARVYIRQSMHAR